MQRSFRLSLMGLSFAVAGLLAGCSTVPQPTSDAGGNDTDTVLTRLPAQTLLPGDCGLFGWTKKDDPAFVFFATEGRAIHLQNGRAVTLDPDGAFPAVTYGGLRLELGPPEPMIDAIRYPNARLEQTLADGFVKIEPLVMLQTCQSEDGTRS
jgi:hypothetical protein